jgi:hypothetical protein
VEGDSETRVAYSVDLAKPENNKLSIYLRLHIMLIKALHNDKAGERTKRKKPQDNENCLNPNKTTLPIRVERYCWSHIFWKGYNN